MQLPGNCESNPLMCKTIKGNMKDNAMFINSGLDQILQLFATNQQLYIYGDAPYNQLTQRNSLASLLTWQSRLVPKK